MLIWVEKCFRILNLLARWKMLIWVEKRFQNSESSCETECCLGLKSVFVSIVLSNSTCIRFQVVIIVLTISEF